MTLMQILTFAAGGVVVVVVAGAAILLLRRRQREAQIAKFKERWLLLQKQCAQPKLWPTIVVDADILIDDVLKALKFKGRGMGERLVSAQRKLSDNDGIWFGHKLRNKISQDQMARLYKKDVQAALRAVRQALQDLGVLS